ncbi:hypothetical protein [Ralstonia pseudosolanacearum]|uniref:hypothetical protein n=1 Tax=Ralstonia pseudosolanacearum TaxID=1310165 RepID=UPI003CF1B641
MADSRIGPALLLDYPVREQVALNGLGQQARFEEGHPGGCQQQYDEQRDDDFLLQLHWRAFLLFKVRWEGIGATGCVSRAWISDSVLYTILSEADVPQMAWC